MHIPYLDKLYLTETFFQIITTEGCMFQHSLKFEMPLGETSSELDAVFEFEGTFEFENECVVVVVVCWNFLEYDELTHDDGDELLGTWMAK